MTLTAEQLEQRRTGIGSSEIGALCGLDPWKNSHVVYGDKRGLLGASEETLPIKLGNLAEELIAQFYASETRVLLDHGATVRHPDHDWIVATPDRLVRGHRRIVEIKWCGWRVAHLWGQDEDAIPPYVRAQVEWQMGVLDIDEAHVAAIVGGDDFRIYTIRRCLPLWEKLVEVGDRFWHDHVLPGVPPPVDGSEGARDVLEAMYREHRPPLKNAPPEAATWVEQIQAARKMIEAGEEQKANAENHLRAMIGEADGITGDFGKVRWMRSKGDKRRTLRLYPPSKRAAEIEFRLRFQATHEDE